MSMFPSNPFHKLIAGKDKLSAREYNRLTETVRKHARISLQHGMASGSGVHNRREAPETRLTLFEVVSAATGDGVYNCKKQIIDYTDWEDTDGTDRLDNVTDTLFEVLNLDENGIKGHWLVAEDLITAWIHTDDEGYIRWIGTPLMPIVRRARTTEAAPATANITCNLYSADNVEILSNIEVYCDIIGGTKLSEAIPRFEDNDDLTIVLLPYDSTTKRWYCTAQFQTFDTDQFQVDGGVFKTNLYECP